MRVRGGEYPGNSLLSVRPSRQIDLKQPRHESTDRLPGLDLLRAIAILWVMDFHAQAFQIVASSDHVARFGWMGVDLFFALSGFLIGSQLLRPLSKGQALRPVPFYFRRLFRTLPPYLAVVSLYFMVPVFRESPRIAPLWQFLTFTENLFVDSHHARAFSHAWSLCIEEQFYLVAPVAAYLLARRPAGWKVVMLCISIVLGGTLLRAAIWLHALAPVADVMHGYGNFFQRWVELIHYPTWTRLDGLLAGVVVAMFKSFRPGVWRIFMRRGNLLLGGALPCLAVAICLFRDQSAFLPSVIGYPILSLGMGCLVAAGASPSSLISRRALPGVGAVAAMAYSLYLTHKGVYHLVGLVAGESLAGHYTLAIMVYGGAALLGGALLYASVERPALLLRDRFLPREAAALPPSAARQLA
jgi:peptidoglycan/LPS O-acetylase OafA/YrhL